MGQTPSSVLEDNNGRSASVTDEGKVKEITLAFQVIYPTVLIFTDDLFTANDGVNRIPFIGEPYVNDTSLKVIGYGHDSIDDDRIAWRVLVNYGNQQGDPNPPPANPLNEPWQINWDTSEERALVAQAFLIKGTLKTKERVAIENAAGDPFDPPPTQIESDMFVVLSKNKAEFNIDQAMLYRNKVNKTSFQIAGYSAAKWTVKLTKYVSGQKSVRNGVTFWPVKYVLKVKPERWVQEYANVGYQYINGSASGKKHLIKLANGRIPVTPQWLGPDGFFFPPEKPNYISYLLEDVIDLAGLNLPKTM